MNRWLWVLGVAVLSLAGCVNPQTRGQSADETEREKDLDVRTIGQVTELANMQFVQVSGVGLVTGLEGTGQSPNGEFRRALEAQLRKQKVENIKERLEDPNNCLVLVTALIPPGARKGDPLDVQISLPQNSKATSLRGGYLLACDLHNYDTTKNLSANYSGADRLVQGHILAHARGPLMVGFGSPDDATRLREARIWGGGISNIDRPLDLMLKKDEKFAAVAKAVADRLNLMFQDDARAQRMIQQNSHLYLLEDMTQRLNQRQEAKGEMAKAVSQDLIKLRVPYAYRFNPERYIRVARLIPLVETSEQHGRYRRRLNKMLLDPTDPPGVIRAALRLEALGRESVPSLQKGLESEHALIRFVCAESLAYLGNTAGVEELARLAERYPEMRMYCLVALSSLDEGICRAKLGEMLTMDDSSLRCGAFRALRLLDESAPRLRKDLGGECLAHSFWLHQVAPKSSRLVYFALGKKAEIVLFGEDIRIAPVSVLVGSEFVVTVNQGDDRCTVRRITTQSSGSYKQCSLQLGDVIRSMADLGAGYPEVVDLLRKLDDRQVLNCPVTANKLPTLVSIEELADSSRQAGFVNSVTGGKGGE